MEQQLPSLNEYQSYYEHQNKLFQKHLDDKLKIILDQLNEHSKAHFEEGLKEVLKAVNNLKQTSLDNYKKTTEQLLGVNDGTIKERRQRMAENMLKTGLEMAESILENYLRERSV